jgi:hypothetical protein
LHGARSTFVVSDTALNVPPDQTSKAVSDTASSEAELACRRGVRHQARRLPLRALEATWPNQRLAFAQEREHASCMPDVPIERAEVVALLFNVSDIAVTLTNIERLLGEDDGEEETDED